jgi:regulator of chromosome condensation
MTDCENRTAPEIIETISDIRTCQIAAGAHHSVACTADNKVFTFGRNTYGQLGHGGTQEMHVPTEVVTLDCTTVTGVGAGANSSFAVCADGSMYAWGYGDGFVLGTGGEEDSFTPTKVDTANLKGCHVLQVSSGGMHSILLATKSSGDVAPEFN